MTSVRRAGVTPYSTVLRLLMHVQTKAALVEAYKGKRERKKESLLSYVFTLVIGSSITKVALAPALAAAVCAYSS